MAASADLLAALAGAGTGYLWPPRPERACAPTQLPSYEADQWVSQAKLDGTCIVVDWRGEKDVRFETRHGPNRPATRWKPGAGHVEAVARIVRSPSRHVFVAEVQHGRISADRAAHLADTPMVMHDVLAVGGQTLVGRTYADRLQILRSMVHGVSGPAHRTEAVNFACPHLGTVRTYSDNFVEHFERLRDLRRNNPEYEGLVVKRASAVLAPCLRPSANAHWQVKCRFEDNATGRRPRSF